MNLKRRNHPLYLAVAALGVLFTVSACAYGVMAFRAAGGGDAYAAVESDAGLMRLMRERGGTILAVEIALLAAVAVAAMAVDRRGDGSDSRPIVSTRDDVSGDVNEDSSEPPSTEK